MKPSAEQILYREPITIVFSDAVAKVYCPVLDSTERAKRMKTIHKASANLLKKIKE